jgi:hypothetical protein
MRIPRTILLTATLAIVPIATTTSAVATTTSGTIRQADNPPPLPGLPGMHGQRGHCMQHKGLGPMQRPPGQKPGDTQQPPKDKPAGAKDCGFGGFPGFGWHHWGRPMTPEQRSCMEKRGFGPGHHDMNRPDRKQRPSRDERNQRRQDFQKAAKDCGVAAPGGFRRGPMNPNGPHGPMHPDAPHGPAGHEPKGHEPAGQGGSGGGGGGQP